MEFKNQYLNYSEYEGLGGTLEETPFNLLEFKAQKIVDKHTFSRLTDLESQEQEVKLCIYELINILNSYNDVVNNSNIASENIDGYNVSYTNVSIELSKSFNAHIKKCIINYLSECKLADGTPYLYCGVE